MAKINVSIIYSLKNWHQLHSLMHSFLFIIFLKKNDTFNLKDSKKIFIYTSELSFNDLLI
jgi:hypothetical protein